MEVGNSLVSSYASFSWSTFTTSDAGDVPSMYVYTIQHVWYVLYSVARETVPPCWHYYSTAVGHHSRPTAF